MLLSRKPLTPDTREMFMQEIVKSLHNFCKPERLKKLSSDIILQPARDQFLRFLHTTHKDSV